MSQVPPFRVDRRRRRLFGDSNSNSFGSLCCDVVNRMREDVNCLCQDAKRLAKLKSNTENRKKQFDLICDSVKYKLKYMAILKFKQPRCSNLTEMKALETRELLKYTWSLTNSILDKRAQGTTFMSIRGIRVVDYMNELLEISEWIQNNYSCKFQHKECLALCTLLSNQLQGLLAPEMLKGDLVVFMENYLNHAVSAMFNLMAIIDLYIQTPRIVDVVGLTNEIFFKSPPASSRRCKSVAVQALSTLLRGGYTGEDPVKTTVPVVESRITSFYEFGAQLTQYILEVSSVTAEPLMPVPQVLLGPGLLDLRAGNGVDDMYQETSLLPESQASR